MRKRKWRARRDFELLTPKDRGLVADYLYRSLFLQTEVNLAHLHQQLGGSFANYRTAAVSALDLVRQRCDGRTL